MVKAKLHLASQKLDLRLRRPPAFTGDEKDSETAQFQAHMSEEDKHLILEF